MTPVRRTLSAALVTGCLLAAAAPVAAEPPADRSGDLLPEGAVARLGTTRFRHGSTIHALAFSPDGKLVASAGADQAVRLWDAVTGKELRSLTGHAAAVTWVGFVDDGKALVSLCEKGTFRVWDPATGKLVRSFAGAGHAPLAAALSADGRALVTRDFDGEVRRWSWAEGKEIDYWSDAGKDGLPTLAVSPDGGLLAWGESGGSVVVWDAAAGKARHRLANRQGLATSLAFTPDGAALVATYEGGDGVVTWDPATGKKLRQAGEDWCPRMVLAATGKVLATTTGAWEVVLRDVEGKGTPDRLEVPGYNRALAFSADGGTLAVGGSDGVVRVWVGKRAREWKPVGGLDGAVKGVRFTPDGKTIVTHDQAPVLRLWDAATGELRDTVKVAGAKRGSGVPWAVLPDGGTVVYATGGKLRHYDHATEKDTERGAVDDSSSATFSEDGTALAVCTVRAVKVYNTASGKVQALLGRDPDEPEPRGLAVAPSGSVVAALGANRVIVRDTSLGQRRCVVEGLEGLAAAAFSPDGRSIACVGDEVVLAETATGLVRLRLPRNGTGAAGVALSPDGRLLAVGGPGHAVHLFDTLTGKEVAKLSGHRGAVTRLTFAPDGGRLASAAEDETVLVWDLAAARKGLPAAEPWADDEAALGRDLAAVDGARGQRAVRVLAQNPRRAVPLLREKLHQVAGDEEIARLIKDLDDEEFAVRRKASQELEALGDRAVPALEKAQADSPSAEVRRRARDLLERRRQAGVDPARARALEVLERLGTDEAKELLEEMAKGPAEAWETQDARRALDRMARRAGQLDGAARQP
jgi:WD40 repeat protein